VHDFDGKVFFGLKEFIPKEAVFLSSGMGVGYRVNNECSPITSGS